MLRIGVADHLGWAVVVTATADHRVADRRRIELVEPDVPLMPVHHHDDALDDAGLAALVADVRASAARATAVALDDLAADLPEPVGCLSLRVWPDDFPTDIATLRRSPWEARADAVMYRQVLAAAAIDLDWDVRTYEAKHVEAEAAARLGARAHDVLHGPRHVLGPPWTKDHRVALAATIAAA